MDRRILNTQTLFRTQAIFVRGVSMLALIAIVATVAFCSNGTLKADEGMWLLNNLPVDYLKNTHGFTPDQKWSQHLMKSCVRFNVGGSASFVSSNGLVLTNHHVGSDTLYKLSTKENNYVKEGFLARTPAEELKAPDLELNQLIQISDVTEKVNQAVTSDLPAAEAAVARRARIGEIESAATEESGLRSDVVTLYGGGKYHLYQYKKYTDVRLVWAPEAAIAFFGGDADNFEYPRFNLDACIFRVYENDKPATIKHFFKWSDDGPAEDELVFVAGNPGRTSRIFTTDALRHQRDVRIPWSLDYIRRREILLQQFALEGPEQDRIARDQLFGFQNARKAYMGELQGLQDPALIGGKAAAEQRLLNEVKSNPSLKDHAAAWQVIADVQKRKLAQLREKLSLRTDLFEIAETLVQMAAEDQKPSPRRLARFQDSGRDSLKQKLFSTAPIYKNLEQVLLGDLIARTCEIRGADDPLCQKILDGKSPLERAAEMIGGTKLDDPEVRKEIAAGGAAAIAGSQDPLIRLAVAVDEKLRADQKISEEIAEIERQAYARIADALFRTQGTSVYPDATFTMRLAFGPVKGYQVGGKSIRAFTDVAGTFAHELNHAGQKDFVLPESWKQAKDKIPGSTKMNFVCTADIIGGNSGSPVVNQELELVGLIFDGNIQSLTADYVYNDKQGRAVSVHSNAIRDSLRYVYDARFLADQLGK